MTARGDFRKDVAGSLLRPPALSQARAAWAQATGYNPLTSADANVALKAAEDAAAREAIQLQIDAGMDLVTDGELRRSSFVGPLTTLGGIGRTPAPTLTLTHVTTGETKPLPMPISVADSISAGPASLVEEFAFARSCTDFPIKVTIPSPLLLHFFWNPEISAQVYPDPFQAFDDVRKVFRQQIEQLAAMGCRWIQLDAPELVQIACDERQRQRWRELGIAPERVYADGIDIVNALAEPIDGVTFSLHTCRANGQSSFLASGGYDSFVRDMLPRATNFSRLLLEYDDERSGDFAPLARIPDHFDVVLGLISTKVDSVESAEEVEQRLRRAAEFLPLERLALSTQCGFASVEQGNDISAASQHAKLRLVSTVAERVWDCDR